MKTKEEPHTASALSIDTAVPIVQLPVLDTTIVLSHIGTSKYQGANLTTGLAKKVLYDYYKKKGLFVHDNTPEIVTDSDADKLVVDYDTIYLADINNNRFADAVITFWMAPIAASGHCYQPHRAIIADTDDGYKITNEEFIPTNFAIDSIKTINGRPVIFGYDYECANDTILQKLRIRLTK